MASLPRTDNAADAATATPDAEHERLAALLADAAAGVLRARRADAHAALARSRTELGALFLLFEDEAAAVARAPAKNIWLPMARLTETLASVGVAPEALTYDRQSTIVVSCVLCGLGAEGDAVFHRASVQPIAAGDGGSRGDSSDTGSDAPAPSAPAATAQSSETNGQRPRKRDRTD